MELSGRLQLMGAHPLRQAAPSPDSVFRSKLGCSPGTSSKRASGKRRENPARE
jgi:hypothetical protein